MKYASVQKRVFAKFIDLLIVLFLGFIWRGGPGSILGFFYSIVADGLPLKSLSGQSLGKKLMHLRVMSGSGPGTLKTSVVRNAPVGLVTFFMIIPFWGWLLAALIGIPLCLIEVSLIVRAERHQRLGDVMSESVVIEIPKDTHVHATHGLTQNHSDHEPKVL